MTEQWEGKGAMEAEEAGKSTRMKTCCVPCRCHGCMCVYLCVCARACARARATLPNPLPPCKKAPYLQPRHIPINRTPHHTSHPPAVTHKAEPARATRLVLAHPPLPHSRPHTTNSSPTPPHTSPPAAARHHTSAPAGCRTVCSHVSESTSHTRTSH